MVKIIIYSVCLSIVLVQMLHIGRIFKRKPFTCEVCLAGWIALILSIVGGYYFDAIGLMAVSMVATGFFNALTNKL